MTRILGRLVIAAGLLWLVGCGGASQEKTDGGAAVATDKAAPAAMEQKAAPAAKQEQPHVTKNYRMKTSLGDVVLELDSTLAPLTVANFDGYVRKGHYDGTIFHRIINDFMIQGGGFDADMTQRPTDPPVENEASNGLKNRTYTIAMARTSAVHSATSQFFINVKNNDFLDFRSPDPQGFGYCVFGKVVEGIDVVDRIKAVPTGTKKGMKDVPNDPVTILEIKPVE